MSEWKPIKSAPRGGDPFLAYDPEDEGKMAVCYFSMSDSLCFEVSGGFANDDFDGTSFAPTHWMPLPSPPEGIGGQ